ncbi:HAD family hydrolase [Streptomyces cacaoi]|uniref:HAD family hydrolase n=1 Tax=Streptomyces cacaoi TaxID=1898 RepID=UPI001FD3BE2E|nr:HAD family phosphatase [Streptomyces cacaoi]
MSTPGGRGDTRGRALLIDLGGVLVADALPTTAEVWSHRLGLTPQDVAEGIYGGDEDQVLIGRMSEPDWWDVVARRLGLDAARTAALRDDLTGHPVYDDALVDAVRAVRPVVRTAFVSNAWPHTRTGLATLLSRADAAVLSCEVGVAKPDPGIYRCALETLGVTARDALFVDDREENVATARRLGMRGHVHTATPETLAAVEEFTGVPLRGDAPGGHGE